MTSPIKPLNNRTASERSNTSLRILERGKASVAALPSASVSSPSDSEVVDAVATTQPDSDVSQTFEMDQIAVEQEMDRLIAGSIQALSLERVEHWLPATCKRGTDILLASILLVVLAPLMAVVALAIRLESAGPIFFVQNRRGRLFRVFRMWKFRSMTHGVPDPSARYETQSTDPRITRIGRFIRKTSIDELPQLFNVIGGSMSLVGPRPLVEWESNEAAKTHGERFLVSPGITGLSQIEVRNSADFETRLDKDVEYVERRSLWLDLLILAKTPWQVACTKMIYPDAD